MTLLLRLAALFFRALSAFDRWLTAADPGEDGTDDVTALAQPENDMPTVPLSACEIDTWHALTDSLEAERNTRLGGLW